MKRLRLVLARVESVRPDGSAVLKPLADHWERPGLGRDVFGLADAQERREAMDTPVKPLMRARREET